MGEHLLEDVGGVQVRRLELPGPHHLSAKGLELRPTEPIIMRNPLGGSAKKSLTGKLLSLPARHLAVKGRVWPLANLVTLVALDKCGNDVLLATMSSY